MCSVKGEPGNALDLGGAEAGSGEEGEVRHGYYSASCGTTPGPALLQELL